MMINSIDPSPFDPGTCYVAGTKYKAPEWIANLGFEWVFRLFQEPKRLFKRYLIDNILFIIYFIKQYLNK